MSGAAERPVQMRMVKRPRAAISAALPEFLPFRRVEVQKALGDLAVSKAPGPDGYPSEVYKFLPATLSLLTHLINAMVSTGSIPAPLLMVHLAPLDKPGKDPKTCESKRPISLINTLLKLTEAAIYNRVIHGLEPTFRPAQYAYRRARGTEAH